MTRPGRCHPVATVAAIVAGVLSLWALLPIGAAGQSQEETQQRIERGRAQEQRLGDAAERLAALERKVQAGIDVLVRRQSAAQAELERAEKALGRTEGELDATRERLADQRRRLARDRKVLAANLVASYEDERPDLMTVVVEAGGFADLIERVEYESEAREANTRILSNVQRARHQTLRAERSLERIIRAQRREATAVRRERDAIVSRSAALQSRRAALSQARQARLQARAAARSDRRRAQRTLARLIKAQEQAAVDKRGPGGPWAIPWAIVQCESGGQNLPPNSAGASGYYQFIPSTWKGVGGSTSHAYQASKAEQDRLAAKLWADGAGIHNWDCAAIVGLT